MVSTNVLFLKQVNCNKNKNFEILHGNAAGVIFKTIHVKYESNKNYKTSYIDPYKNSLYHTFYSQNFKQTILKTKKNL